MAINKLSKQKTLFESWKRNPPLPTNSKTGKKNSSASKSSAQYQCDQSSLVDLCNEVNDADLLSATVALEYHCNDLSSQENAKSSDCDELDGFDKFSGSIWIYPTNYPVRDYQLSITKAALFKNTLVALPTGLGKTFIAAVVLYNFYRWYPQGKVVFMAPTKPLVSQQIEACYKIMGIPMKDQAQITGATMASNRRAELWTSKRVFFVTPQIICNDLAKGVCSASLVKCLVIDEAHKALGNHAYCQVVQQLLCHTRNFRVLALSATPGSDLKTVQQVINNLLISRIELRGEDAIDIQQYVHMRNVEKVTVKLTKQIVDMQQRYYNVIEMFVTILSGHKAIYNRDVRHLTKYAVLMARDQFRKDPPPGLSRNSMGILEGTFAILISLYHGLELLLQHGMRSFYIFLKGIMDGEKSNMRSKSMLNGNENFRVIYEELLKSYGDNPESVVLCTQAGGTQHASRRPEVNQQREDSYTYGHPKMIKLEEVVIQHFQQATRSSDSEHSTRVMIFCQYRDIVREVTELLQRHRPLIRPMQFIGHAPSTNPYEKAGGKSNRRFTQKDQLMVVNKFRSGDYNTLVSTCVGEEGLDIGDVDLIVCYDAHKSPIRLVQRMGRTGRKRKGRIVMLVTEGKEERDYNSSLASRRSIHKAILGAGKSLQYYPHSPVMVPSSPQPQCHMMFITVPEQSNPGPSTSKSKAKEKKPSTSNVALMLKKSLKSQALTAQQLEVWKKDFMLSAEERKEFKSPPDIGTRKCIYLEKELWGSNSDASTSNRLSLSEWLPWQSRLHPVKLVGHSSRTKTLAQILHFCDNLREKGATQCGYPRTCDVTDASKPTFPDSRSMTHERRKEQRRGKKRKPLIVLSDDEDFFPDDFQDLPPFDCKTHSTTPSSVDERAQPEAFPEQKESPEQTARGSPEATTSSPLGDELDLHQAFELESSKDSSCPISANLSALPSSPNEKKEDEMSSFRSRKVSKSLFHVSLNGPRDPSCANAISFDFRDVASGPETKRGGEVEKKASCFKIWESDENSNHPSETSEVSDQSERLDLFECRASQEDERTLLSLLETSACEITDLESPSKIPSINKRPADGAIALSAKDVIGRTCDDVNTSCNNAEQRSPHRVTLPSLIERNLRDSLVDGGCGSFDASADMFAPQFDLHFDLGVVDKDEKRPGLTSASPQVSRNTGLRTADERTASTSERALADEESYSKETHPRKSRTPLSPTSMNSFNLSQCKRLENRKLFAEFHSPVVHTPPCAKVIPQQQQEQRSMEDSCFIIDNTPVKVTSNTRSQPVLKSLKRRKHDDVMHIPDDWDDDDMFQLVPSPVKKRRCANELFVEDQGLSESSPLITTSHQIGAVLSDEDDSILDTPFQEINSCSALDPKNENERLAQTGANSNDLPFSSLAPSLSGVTLNGSRCASNPKQSTPKVDRPSDQSRCESTSSMGKKTKPEKGRRCRRNVFICEEAEVSGGRGPLSSDEDDDTDDDVMRDFVNDASQLTQLASQGIIEDERAMYLRSVADKHSQAAVSTEMLGGRYKLAYNVGKNLDVFSQVPDHDASDYVNDSFCVGNDDVTLAVDFGEVTLLDDAERMDSVGPRTRARFEMLKYKEKAVKNKVPKKIMVFEEEDDDIDITQLSSPTHQNYCHRAKAVLQTQQCDAFDRSIDTPVRHCELCGDVIKNKGWLCSQCVLVMKQSKAEQKLLDGATMRISDEKKYDSEKKLTSRDSPPVVSCLNKDERLLRSKQKQEELRKKLKQKRSSLDSNEGDARKTRTPIRNDTNPQSDVGFTERLQPSSPTLRNVASSSAQITTNQQAASSNQVRSSDKATVFIDNKEVSSGATRVAQLLRTSYVTNVHVVSLQCCSYVVSSRCAIFRKTVDDLANATKRQKLSILVKRARVFYEQLFVIVEKQKAKKGWVDVKSTSNQFTNLTATLVALAEADLRVLHSDSQENTAQILHMLASHECTSGFAIASDVLRCVTDKQLLPMMNIYLSIPGISYVNALYLCNHFKSLKGLLKSSVDKLITDVRLSRSVAENLFAFLRKKFDIRFVPL